MGKLKTGKPKARKLSEATQLAGYKMTLELRLSLPSFQFSCNPIRILFLQIGFYIGGKRTDP